MTGLEAALERGILLDVLAVLIERGRAEALELAARERGLQDVGRVDRALGRARANQRVNLVNHLHAQVGHTPLPLPSAPILTVRWRRTGRMISCTPQHRVATGGNTAARRRERAHQDDVVVLLDLVHQLLQPLLKLTAVLGARHQQPHVQRHHLLPLDRLRHVTVGDLLREALGDRGLADAGLADEARVVLCAAAEDLDHALDLLCAAHDRVELALYGSVLVRGHQRENR